MPLRSSSGMSILFPGGGIINSDCERGMERYCSSGKYGDEDYSCDA